MQNSWQPSVYQLPQQAPPTPPGFDYQFSAPGNPPMLNTGYVPRNEGRGHIVANAPVAPVAPGYIGPSMAQAYQMAGPRVGFQTPQAPVQSMPGQMPSAPPASVVNPFLGGGFAAGGGGGGSLFSRLGRMIRAV
jgi:hypothetical protein